METNRTTGSVFKNVLFFSLPYLLSYFLQTLYGMADLFIVGQYENVAATTAVSVGSQVMHMLTVMIVGLAMGSTVSIGQSVGRGDKARTSYAIGNTVTLFMALSLVPHGNPSFLGARDRVGHVHPRRRRFGNGFVSHGVLYRHSLYYGIQYYKLDLPRDRRLEKSSLFRRRRLCRQHCA